MTRAEHVKWCKERAWQEYKYYLPKDGEKAAMRNATASMMSDLVKHTETAGMLSMAYMISQTVKDYASLKSFIDGFTE